MNNGIKTSNSAELKEALNIFGKMLNIALIYGMNHPSVKDPLAETHCAFESALKDSPQVTIGLFNKALTVNDKIISEYTIHLRALERRLVSLNIPQLIIRRGLSLDELAQLIGALCTANAKTGTTLKEKLEEAGLSHIKTEEVEYVAQHEGEHLIGKGGCNLDETGEDEKDGNNAAEKEHEPEPEPPPTVHVEQIVAFLKGETTSSETPSADLEQMLSEPEKLGQLIMESAVIRQSAQSLDDSESLADIVIGCLRKTYEDLSCQKKFKSARGKTSLNKAMLLLEKTVVDKIRNAIDDGQPEVDEQILSALHEMEEERQVEILAARYAEQHKKLTRAETEIIRYAREHGEKKARELLDAAEVPENEWRRLLASSRNGGSRNGGGNGNSSGEAIDMGTLAIVLDKLDNIMHLDDVPPAMMSVVMKEARNDIQDVAAQFEQKVEELEEQAELYEKEPEGCKMSRADLLLEISQLSLKLAQPLTVINASIEAALQQLSNPDFQKELLELAHESGLSMKDLMERLTAMVGYPTLQEADAGLSE